MPRLVFCVGHGSEAIESAQITFASCLRAHINGKNNVINIILYTPSGGLTKSSELKAETLENNIFAKIISYHVEHREQPLEHRCNAIRSVITRELLTSHFQVKQAKEHNLDETNQPPIIINLIEGLGQHRLHPFTSGDFLENLSLDDVENSEIISTKKDILLLSDIIREQQKQAPFRQDLEIHWLCCRASNVEVDEHVCYLINGEIPNPTRSSHIRPEQRNQGRRTSPTNLSGTKVNPTFPSIIENRKYWSTRSERTCNIERCNNPTGRMHRHHCRICGDGHYCDGCAPKLNLIDAENRRYRVRVCRDCRDMYEHFIQD